MFPKPVEIANKYIMQYSMFFGRIVGGSIPLKMIWKFIMTALFPKAIIFGEHIEIYKSNAWFFHLFTSIVVQSRCRFWQTEETLLYHPIKQFMFGVITLNEYKNQCFVFCPQSFVYASNPKFSREQISKSRQILITEFQNQHFILYLSTKFTNARKRYIN